MKPAPAGKLPAGGCPQNVCLDSTLTLSRILRLQNVMPSLYLAGSVCYLLGSILYSLASALPADLVSAVHAGNALFVFGSFLFVADGYQSQRVEPDG